MAGDPLGPIDYGYLGDIADAFLKTVVACLEPTPAGAPATILVAHSTPPDDCCDFVNVVYTGFRPTAPGSLGAPQTGTPSERCEDVKFAAEVAVTVARSGAPTVRASRTRPIPAAQAEHNLAVALLADAAVLMHCAIPQMTAAAKDLVDWRWTGQPLVSGGRLTPFNLGGCAGWSAALVFALPLLPPELVDG